MEKRDPDQTWFWSEEWQKGEEEAEADIRNGRLKSFNSLEELFADLDREDDEE